ncbi:hypothetical protein E5M78_21150, partial [Mycobacterium tuberculosis]
MQPDRNLLADLDHIFVDRSLGAVQVPQLLRDAGFRLTTMREHYGETQAQSVSDHKCEPPRHVRRLQFLERMGS